MKIRSGNQVATVDKKDGQMFTVKVDSFPSINAAKKANGLNSRTAKVFPPHHEQSA